MKEVILVAGQPETNSTHPLTSLVRKAIEEVWKKSPDKGSLSTSKVVEPETSPIEVLRSLRQLHAGRLLLPEGENLSVKKPNDYQPFIELEASEGALEKVWVRGYQWTQEALRRDVETGDIYRYPEAQDWSGLLDIQIHYLSDGTPRNRGMQMVGVNAPIGARPYFGRRLHLSSYAEMGYDGHRDEYDHNAFDESIVEFVDFCQELTGPNS